MEKSNHLSRRDAVKLAGAAGAAMAASQLDGAPAIVKAAGDQVRFGLIGTGSRGDYLLKHLHGIDNGRCVALCDINQEHLDRSAQTIGTNPAKYKDYRELLSRNDVDAVIIAVPLFMHFPVTKDALLAGKHTFCEKSLVFRPRELAELRALVDQRPKQVLQVGLQRRYSEFYQAVKSMVDKGILGNVTHMYAQWNRNPGWKMKPMPNKEDQMMANWRLYRQYSGGLAAELASHQVDVAEWMFGSPPESIIGVGGHDYQFDGRDILDNIQMIYKYPKKQKLISMYISTNSHLALFNSTRTEFGELIMGTEGAVEITVGDDTNPVLATWYREPAPPPSVTPANEKKAYVAGATMVAAGAQKGVPILLDRDKVTPNENFLDREMKFARQWLYSKGVMMPEEQRNPVDTELQSFFNDCRTGGRPKANIDVGLADSATVILTNLALDEDRKVMWSELDELQKGPAVDTKSRKS
ncbi:MAG TPA: Gfo/Idh/MocA family oxidoreductase [Bryobacteraceae bacterium]|nr:Gfo/Idh/MocA family oxidoreductase [Bryobacteraceae bacterium]